MTEEMKELLDDLMDYHKPDEERAAKHQKINDAAKAFAAVIVETCPGCPDATSAIRKIREARMEANSALATKSGGLIRW